MSIKYLVCTYPKSYKIYYSHWKDFPYPLEWVNDNTIDSNLVLDFNYNESIIRKSFKFDKEVPKTHFWNSEGNRNIIWFYAHFRMVYYYRSNPNYDYYWFFDDDVTVEDWSGFLKPYEKNTSDFISYYCFKHPNVNSQPNIPPIDSNTYSNLDWFNRFPGVGDEVDPKLDLFGSFFPIVRLSNKALSELSNLIEKGIHGYSEGMVPTTLNQKGMTLDTIFTPQDINKYKVKHKHTEIKWNWI